MKLRKDKWAVVKLKDVIIDIKDGGTPSRSKLNILVVAYIGA